ncbi:MAG: PQQ-binding-like beta-propeller repeat protein [Bauldia sp.]
MRTHVGLLMAGVAAAAVGLPTAAQAQAPGPGAFPPVTGERMKNADKEPQNWLMASGNWSNWHYSFQNQINRDNVKNLHVVYMSSIGGCAMPQGGNIGTACNEAAQPLVDNGIMYLNDNQGRVMAYDVSSGDRAFPLWRFDPKVPAQSTDRGIALYGNWVIQTTGGPESGGKPNARIIAIDRKSGEAVWEIGAQEPVDQPNTADMIASRSFPGLESVFQTASGKNIIVPSPTGSGIGYVAAYDADNGGKLLWRTYTIPQPGEPNFGTWPKETWRNGAVMPWGIAAFDPDSNTIYKGTGEPSPVYDPEYRPGDNLYAVSTLALDADTGKMKWYFQEVPNDQWDYDSTGGRILFDLKAADGSTRKVLANWERNGFTYILDRTNGLFIDAIAQVDNINWTKGIDPKTGKPVEYRPDAGVQTYGVAGPRRGRAEADAPQVCATWGGGTTGIWPASFDPRTGITYNTRTTGCTFQTITQTTDAAFNPLVREGLGSTVRQVQVDTKFALIAIDTAKGKVLKTFIRDQGIPGDRQAEVGALATAGGLVFTAGDDGRVSAFNSDTLEEMWHFNAGTGMKGGIMSFGVGGKQYIAKIVGGDNPGAGGISRFKLPTAMLVVWGL